MYYFLSVKDGYGRFLRFGFAPYYPFWVGGVNSGATHTVPDRLLLTDCPKEVNEEVALFVRGKVRYDIVPSRKGSKRSKPVRVEISEEAKLPPQGESPKNNEAGKPRGETGRSSKPSSNNTSGLGCDGAHKEPIKSSSGARRHDDDGQSPGKGPRSTKRSGTLRNVPASRRAPGAESVDSSTAKPARASSARVAIKTVSQKEAVASKNKNTSTIELSPIVEGTKRRRGRPRNKTVEPVVPITGGKVTSDVKASRTKKR